MNYKISKANGELARVDVKNVPLLINEQVLNVPRGTYVVGAEVSIHTVENPNPVFPLSRTQ
jgi:hypothetical protein